MNYISRNSKSVSMLCALCRRHTEVGFATDHLRQFVHHSDVGPLDGAVLLVGGHDGGHSGSLGLDRRQLLGQRRKTEGALQYNSFLCEMVEIYNA